jgi:hypothetical protein
MHFVRDFNQRQSELFLVVATFLRRYQPSELQPLVDDDVEEATAALAATYETAARGVIYEHRPASAAAERLGQSLKPALAEARQHHGAAFERDAAVVLRRVESAVRDVRAGAPGERRAFLELIERIVRKTEAADPQGASQPSRLIVP